jgi:hypothetical protein
MKFSVPTLGGVALAVLLVQPPAARAELVHWMYNWSRSPSVIHADAPGTSTITLTDEPMNSATGNSDIVATNLKTYSTAPADKPDHFTHAGYTLSLYLYDTASGQGGTLNFTGFFDGTVSSQNSELSNTFTGNLVQTLRLGDHLFTARVDSYTPPGIPGASNSGSIGGHVSITIQTLPEPGTLALSGLGMILLGVARWRRAVRRRASPEHEAP